MTDSPRIEELKRRVQSDPASIAFAALAEEYRRSGRFEEAISTCLSGLQRHPSYVSAHVTLGRALLEVGDYDEARQELELVLRVAPENLAAIRGLAEIHHRRGDAAVTTESSAADTGEISAAAPVEQTPDAAQTPPPAAPEPIRLQTAPIPIVTEPRQPGIAVAPPQSAIAVAPPQPAIAVGLPQPAIAVAPPQPAIAVAPPQPAIGVAPPQPTITTAPAPPPQLAEDRALAGLEEFLQAILRARKAASHIQVS